MKKKLVILCGEAHTDALCSGIIKLLIEKITAHPNYKAGSIGYFPEFNTADTPTAESAIRYMEEVQEGINQRQIAILDQQIADVAAGRVDEKLAVEKDYLTRTKFPYTENIQQLLSLAQKRKIGFAATDDQTKTDAEREQLMSNGIVNTMEAQGIQIAITQNGYAHLLSMKEKLSECGVEVLPVIFCSEAHVDKCIKDISEIKKILQNEPEQAEAAERFLKTLDPLFSKDVKKIHSIEDPEFKAIEKQIMGRLGLKERWQDKQPATMKTQLPVKKIPTPKASGEVGR